MKNLNRLAELARQLEQQTAVCKRCGICQSVCPLFPLSRLEKDIARGKIAVLEGVMTEVVKNAETVLAQLNRCLLCGRCAAACPNGVDTEAIFLQARFLLSAYGGLSPVKKFLFRRILAHPRRFNRAVRLAEIVQPVFFRAASAPTAARRPRRITSAILSGRQVPSLARVPLHCSFSPSDPARAPAAGERVVFFSGCLIDKIFPAVGQASLDALRRHGFQPSLLEEEACCGIPALSSGDQSAFMDLLAHNLCRLEPQSFSRLVTACATCAFTIKKLWPKMAGPDHPEIEKIRAVAEKTIDITALIADRLPAEPPAAAAGAEPVTYHDPCHLKTSLGISEPPRRLIAAAPGYRLVEMEKADACCGMGGGFGLAHPDLSAEIGRSKADHILATGCRVIATACPACMIQLSGLLSPLAGEDFRVCHPIELYMQQFDGD